MVSKQTIVFQNILYSSIGFAAEKASRVFISMVLAKHFAAPEYGKYTLAFSIFFIVSTIGSLSLPNALIRFYKDAPYKSGVTFLHHIFFCSNLCTMISLIIAYGLSKTSVFNIFAEKLETFVYPFLLSTFLYNSVQILSAYARAKLEYIKDTIIRYIVPSFILVGGVIFTIWQDKYIVFFVYFWPIAYLISFTIGLILIKDTRFTKIIDSLKIMQRFIIDYKNILIYGIIVTLISIVAILLSEIDRFVVGALLSGQELGVFGLTLLLASVPSMIISALNPLLPPLIVMLRKSREFLQFFFTLYVEFLLLLSSPILIMIAFYSERILAFFGSDYAAYGTVPLNIMLIAAIINIITGPCGIYLQYLGKERIDLKISGVTSIVSLGISLFLIFHFGLNGAALSYLTSLSLVNIGRYLMLRKHYKVNINIRVIIMLISLFLIIIWEIYGLPSSVFIITISVCLYFIALFLFIKSKTIYNILKIYKTDLVSPETI